MIDDCVVGDGDREIPLAMFGVGARYLEALLDEMTKQFGTIEVCFSDGLGIDVAGLDAPGELLVE